MLKTNKPRRDRLRRGFLLITRRAALVARRRQDRASWFVPSSMKTRPRRRMGGQHVCIGRAEPNDRDACGRLHAWDATVGPQPLSHRIRPRNGPSVALAGNPPAGLTHGKCQYSLDFRAIRPKPRRRHNIFRSNFVIIHRHETFCRRFTRKDFKSSTRISRRPQTFRLGSSPLRSKFQTVVFPRPVARIASLAVREIRPSSNIFEPHVL